MSQEDTASVEENPMEYEEHSWPVDEDPTGFSYKGKKRIFIKAVENLKILMTKGNQKDMSDVSFKVLDSRKAANRTEIDVEVKKDKSRGVAVLKLYGPTTNPEGML